MWSKDATLYDIVKKTEGSGWGSKYFTAKPEYQKEYDAPLFDLSFCVDREHKFVYSQSNAVLSHLGRGCSVMIEKKKKRKRSSSFERKDM